MELKKRKWINVGEGEWVGGEKNGHLKSGEGKGGPSGVKKKGESVAGKGKGRKAGLERVCAPPPPWGI